MEAETDLPSWPSLPVSACYTELQHQAAKPFGGIGRDSLNVFIITAQAHIPTLSSLRES